MSYLIRVDYSKIETAAAAIDTYVDIHKTKMNSANTEVTALCSSWQGQDSMQFQTQWNGVMGAGSTSKMMISALEDYAEYLRFAAKKYKEAQNDAIVRANRISLW